MSVFPLKKIYSNWHSKKGYCSSCGQDYTYQSVYIDGHVFPLCGNCFRIVTRVRFRQLEQDLQRCSLMPKETNEIPKRERKMKCKDCKFIAMKIIKKSAASRAWLGDATTENGLVCRKHNDKITKENHECCEDFMTNHID